MLEKFNDWMKCTVQSIHYSDNNAMNNAFERLEEDRINQIEVIDFEEL